MASPNAEEKRFQRAMVELGCAVCGCAAVEYHHCRGLEYGCGMGLKAPHTCGFGICLRHHRELHDTMGKNVWEKKYGRQGIYWAKQVEKLREDGYQGELPDVSMYQ